MPLLIFTYPLLQNQQNHKSPTSSRGFNPINFHLHLSMTTISVLTIALDAEKLPPHAQPTRYQCAQPMPYSHSNLPCSGTNKTTNAPHFQVHQTPLISTFTYQYHSHSFLAWPGLAPLIPHLHSQCFPALKPTKQYTKTKRCSFTLPAYNTDGELNIQPYFCSSKTNRNPINESRKLHLQLHGIQ